MIHLLVARVLEDLAEVWIDGVLMLQVTPSESFSLYWDGRNDLRPLAVVYQNEEFQVGVGSKVLISVGPVPPGTIFRKAFGVDDAGGTYPVEPEWLEEMMYPAEDWRNQPWMWK